VKPTAVDPRRLRPSRRGITLVEMLVTVAVLVLLMTILVQIFQAATGALSSAQSYQELDDSLRRLDATIRSDLNGVTARLTPPLNPKDGLGYLEYGENAFADIQGEDSDDYIRFTAKAPAGRPFRGRVLLPPPVNPSALSAGQLNTYINNQPILVTSEFAEIIYFVRNGNLYRRVFLIAPERQGSIVQMTNNTMPAAQTGWANNFVFHPGAYGGNAAVSWLGVNDLSARPASSGPGPDASDNRFSHIVLNSLGDLTNRENRAFYQRFSNDYVDNKNTNTFKPDGIADDTNNDGVPDFYPTLYVDTSAVFTAALQGLLHAPNNYVSNLKVPGGKLSSSMAFPYMFPGAYTQPETDSGLPQLGWIHSPTPDQTTNTFRTSSTNAKLYLDRLNHNPLDVGDNLYRPIAADGTFQTWWGFPTASETLSFGWTDPTWQLNLNAGVQPPGLNPRNPTNMIGGLLKVADDAELLPPMTGDSVALGGPVRVNPQLYSDDFGTGSSVLVNYGEVNAAGAKLWGFVGEDDLIMTGVRSFDIKVYDDLYAGYVDLGWKNDLRINLGSSSLVNNVPEFEMTAPNTTNGYNFLTGTPTLAFSPFAGGSSMATLATFGHEGRMPPLVNDNRLDPNSGVNVGDNATNINRLRRVFDTWSTAYTMAPSHAVDPATGLVYGPPFSLPVYPSYPPPYPAPLKGIQIQVRVVDPTNQRIKQVTIRHDFTDRL
jgi:Prokaryotic N-terminal methylation motif